MSLWERSGAETFTLWEEGGGCVLLPSLFVLHAEPARTRPLVFKVFKKKKNAPPTQCYSWWALDCPLHVGLDTKRCSVAPAARKVQLIPLFLWFPKQRPFQSLASGFSRPGPHTCCHRGFPASACLFLVVLRIPPPRAPSFVASASLSCPCLCSGGLRQTVLSCAVAWRPHSCRWQGKCPFAAERGSEGRSTVLADSPFVPRPVRPRRVGTDGGLSSEGCEAVSRGRGPGQTAPGAAPVPVSSSRLSPASKMLRCRLAWWLLSVGPSISLVTVFHGSEQACLFSAVSKSWHGHNNGGQETGAGSMWYLVSVIFCNTYVLPVEMAEASVFVSHLIHLASLCCVCLSGSRWSFVFWDPLSPRPYLGLTGQGIHNLLPLLCKLHTLPGSQHVASTSPRINQFLLLRATTLLCFLLEKYMAPFIIIFSV